MRYPVRPACWIACAQKTWKVCGGNIYSTLWKFSSTVYEAFLQFTVEQARVFGSMHQKELNLQCRHLLLMIRIKSVLLQEQCRPSFDPEINTKRFCHWVAPDLSVWGRLACALPWPPIFDARNNCLCLDGVVRLQHIFCTRRSPVEVCLRNTDWYAWYLPSSCAPIREMFCLFLRQASIFKQSIFQVTKNCTFDWVIYYQVQFCWLQREASWQRENHNLG